MKILHITWQMAIGGMERAIYQLVRAQNENGNKADLLVVSKSSFYSELLKQERYQVYELRQRRGLDLSKLKKFNKIITDYDVLHFHGGNPILMYFAKKAGNKKLHYSQRAGKHSYSIKKKLFYRLISLVIRKSFVLSANTLFAAKVSAALYKIPIEKISVLYNGIDFSLLNPRRSKKDVLDEIGDSHGEMIRIGTTGKLLKLKRHDLLINALSKINKKSYMCYIIGDGPEASTLNKLINKHGLEGNIKLIGQKKHIGDYLQLFDIFVLPSDQSESFGNSVVEAMGVGIPSIVFKDGGGIVEHIQSNCGFIAEDVDDLVRILDKLIDSQELRLKIGQKGMEYVRSKYSIGNMIQAYKELYLNS